MMSQETIDFVEDIVKTILSRWDTLDMKDKMRDESTLVLLRVFPEHIFLRGVVATPLGLSIPKVI